MRLTNTLSSINYFLLDIYKSRGLLLKLAVKDFRTRYIGSYLGLIWAFIMPFVTILVFWFVFQFGFKVVPIKDTPFILWLMCGLVPWFFFSEALSGATSSVSEYSFLVKKVVFRVSLLPIIKIISALFTHIFFLLVLVVFFLLYKYSLSLYMLQAIYYTFAMFTLLLGLSWITSALNVFTKDVGQFITMVIQFGFWITPIFWSYDMLPEKFHFFLKLNPIFYITEGFRDSFIRHIWFWDHWKMSIYFWTVTFIIFGLGAFVFRKLRPHFADVL